MKRGKINKKTIIITVVLVLAAAAVAVPLERRLFQKSTAKVSEEVEKEIVSYGENEINTAMSKRWSITPI